MSSSQQTTHTRVYTVVQLLHQQYSRVSIGEASASTCCVLCAAARNAARENALRVQVADMRALSNTATRRFDIDMLIADDARCCRDFINS